MARNGGGIYPGEPSCNQPIPDFVPSTDFLSGTYLGLGGTYKLDAAWSILGSGRYQYLQSYDLDTNDSQVSLSFESAFTLSLSAAYSF